MTEFINKGGSVCAPKGFVAGGVHCGIRKNQQKKDLGIIFSQTPCAAAAVYTKNKLCAAPITVTKANLHDAKAHAVIVNSGNANACTADGMQKAQAMCALTANALNIDKEDVIVASTGVIGQTLDIAPIEKGVAALAPALSADGYDAAAEAIMTTDLAKKEIALGFSLSGFPVTIGGIAKGSGMIHPNMATMLAFLTTDAAISPALLQQALSMATEESFNMISVDGDTSTNDMLAILANGLGSNPEITEQNEDFWIFYAALKQVCVYLARCIATDGEGATHLITCNVAGAPDKAGARAIAKSIICSSLVKAAVFGADANWGRILCAIGYAQADFAIDKVEVVISSAAGAVKVCENGAGILFSEQDAKRVLLEKEIVFDVNLHQGEGCATAWGCDLTYDYVRINGDYRS
jgi:glutamate N-acetyltransferase/amino-acid N-acetyltransferase